MIPKTNDSFHDNQDGKSLKKIPFAFANRIQQRRQMVVLHQAGINSKTIAWFVNRHIATVGRWISRVKNSASLRDAKRSGRPAVYTEKVQLKTIAFYCQVSPLPGCNSWSLRWAENYLKEHNEIIGCSISHSTIGRILKRHALRPHLNRYFLNITDPDFFPKMDHIVNLYLNQPDYLFCFDECTGLQAKHPLTPDLPVAHGKPRYEEFEYKRNGTTDLMAFLNTKTGKVFGRCTQNHKTHTLVGVFKEHVRTLPSNVTLHYIADNLNTHFNNEFCQAVGELSKVTYTPLKTGIERREWLQKEDKRIVFHFIPFHGSWLNMIEIWFGILSKRCLKHQSFPSVSRLQEVISEFIEIWNNHFAHPFTWRYTGQGLYEKAVGRFHKLLLIESGQMDITFLTKQLLLMRNIAQSYQTIQQTKLWSQLYDVIIAKNIFIESIINGVIKKRQRLKAQQALEELMAVF